MPATTDYPVAPSPVGEQVFSGPVLDTTTWSDPIDVWGFDELDFRVKVSNLGTGPITSITATLQWTDTDTGAAGDEDWATVQVETLAADGTVTEADAAYTFSVPGAAPFSLPVLGQATGRWMRIGLEAIGGDASSAAIVRVMKK
jgi:hypothetical protein